MPIEPKPKLPTHPDKPSRLSFDEAAALIEDVAKNGEGAQQLRALQMVMANQSSAITLPPPMSTDEVVERLARVMRAAGSANCQFAYRKAFAKTRKEIFETHPVLQNEDIQAFHANNLPMTVKQLYRRFPEIKRGGFPPGYPVRGGLEAQTEWCQKKAIEILKKREEDRLTHLPTDAKTKVEGDPEAYAKT